MTHVIDPKNVYHNGENCSSFNGREREKERERERERGTTENFEQYNDDVDSGCNLIAIRPQANYVRNTKQITTNLDTVTQPPQWLVHLIEGKCRDLWCGY